MKSTTHIPLLIISVVVFLAAAAGYAFLYTRVTAQASEERALAAAAGEASAQDDRSRAAAQLLDAVADDRAAVTAYVIAKDDVAHFIGIIEALGGKSDTEVTVLSVAIADGSELTRHEMLRLTFSSEGSFAGVSRVLALLEALPYPITIEQAYLERSGAASSNKKGADRSWTGSFTITVLKQK